MKYDNQYTGASISDFCSQLPIKRHAYEAKGKLLLLQRLGMVVVPYRYEFSRGYWACVVIKEGWDERYGVGGNDIVVFDCEIETAEELTL